MDREMRHDHSSIDNRILLDFLDWAPFPSVKKELIDFAHKVKADEYILNILDELPNIGFDSPADVASHINRMHGT
jgi:hypothetical protein